MLEPYRLETLPLEAHDDDPHWALYLDLFANAFLDKRPSAESVVEFRNSKRADGATLGMVTAEGPGLNGRQPVAGFSWSPTTLNAGAGIVPAMVVNTAAVRSTHRRRGLLRELMTHHLALGRAQGNAYAVLTASEATIYGRFGFGVATRYVDWDIDTRRFALRPDVTVADGVVEVIDPASITPCFEQISNAFQRSYRGACGPQSMHRRFAEGGWDIFLQGPAQGLRYLVHFNALGEPDGFAQFEHKGLEDDAPPAPSRVIAVCSPDPAIDRALWRALASFDIVERLSYGAAAVDDPLPWCLTDPWAINIKAVHDGVWLRLLDMEKAVAERGFESDGEITMRVDDAMGLCSGTWRIRVDAGRGTAARDDGEAEVALDISALARLWFGDVTASQLARAELIKGEASAVRRMSRLFATERGPSNLVPF